MGQRGRHRGRHAAGRPRALAQARSPGLLPRAKRAGAPVHVWRLAKASAACSGDESRPDALPAHPEQVRGAHCDGSQDC